MNIRFPYQYNNQGKTTSSASEAHIKDMIEMVLFTIPGERPNRPTFGCGLRQLLFQPNSDELATTAQFLIQGELQQWLGDLIEVEEVVVENQDTILQVTIRYIIRTTQKETTYTFVKQ